jgi:hypothetical protein
VTNWRERINAEPSATVNDKAIADARQLGDAAGKTEVSPEEIRNGNVAEHRRSRITCTH